MRARWLFPMIVLLATGCGRKQVTMTPKAVPLRDDSVIALQVATFNLRYENDGDKGRRAWRERFKPVIGTLARMNPDVFGIQEGLHGMMADLRASLPDYGFHGIGRDDGKWEGEYSAIFYRNDRFEPDLSDAGNFLAVGDSGNAGLEDMGQHDPTHRSLDPSDGSRHWSRFLCVQYPLGPPEPALTGRCCEIDHNSNRLPTPCR